MAFRKFRKFGRKSYGRKRTYRKRFSRSGNTRFNKRGKRIHMFKRTVVYRTNAQNNVSGFDAVGNFNNSGTVVYNEWHLDQLPNYTEFTNLYDSYKICGIKVKVQLDKNSSDTGATEPLPNLVTVNDFNDNQSLSTEATALQYASYKSKRLSQPVSRYFRPTMKADGSSTTTARYIKSSWIPTSNVSLEHCGLKMGLQSNSINLLGQLTIYSTFYIACMSPK